MKPGHLTTEFWVTAATDVALLAAALSSALPAKWAAICAAVANVAYALSRGLAKQGVAPVPVIAVTPAVAVPVEVGPAVGEH